MNEKPAGRSRGRLLRGLNAEIWAVGFISLLTDASSEMIFPLLPMFLALSTVGQGEAVALVIGILEGIGETTAALLKLGSGLWTDRVPAKKPLILLGYGLSSIVRPFMGLAAAWWQPVMVRFLDRVGKGIRTSPRDVLIAQSAPAEYRGKAFGFQRSMDHIGAVLGPLLAVALIYLLPWNGNGEAGRESLLRTIFLLSAVPGAFCLAVIIFWLREVRATPTGAAFRLSWRGFDRNYRYYLGCLFLFTLGNSSDMFLILRAVQVMQAERQFDPRLMLALVPLLWAFFHFFKAVTVSPLGALSDRVGRRNLIRLGWGVYALIYLGFAFMRHSWQAWPLFAIYAVYYGLTEGAEKALIVDLAPQDLRGTAVGMYHFTMGIAALPASLVFGVVYARVGALAAFGYAAALALLAMVLLTVKVRETPIPGPSPVNTGV